MTIYRVQLVSAWTMMDKRNEMRVALEHGLPGVAYTDVTGQPDAHIPTIPNALIVEVYPVDDALLAALEADSTLVVLTATPETGRGPKDDQDEPTVLAKRTLKTLLETRFGLSKADLDNLIDESANRLTRQAISHTLRVFLRTRPKASEEKAGHETPIQPTAVDHQPGKRPRSARPRRNPE